MQSHRSPLKRALRLLATPLVLVVLALLSLSFSTQPQQHGVLAKPKGSSSSSGSSGSSSSAERQARFAKLARQDGGAIQGDTALFNELTAAPRNYSVTVLLTALAPQFGCDPCRQFQLQWEAVGRSWLKKRDDSHFFVTMDFLKSKEIFQRVR